MSRRATVRLPAVAGRLRSERLGSPLGLASDNQGGIYIADGSAIAHATAAGVMTVYAGKPGTFTSTDNVDPLKATFSNASALTVDYAGNVFVVDGNLIRKVAAGGGPVTTSAGAALSLGVRLGPAPFSLGAPTAIMATPLGDLMVADEYSVLLLRQP